MGHRTQSRGLLDALFVRLDAAACSAAVACTRGRCDEVDRFENEHLARVDGLFLNGGLNSPEFLRAQEYVHSWARFARLLPLIDA